MVKSVIDGVITYYVGGIYELEVNGEVETERKYYRAGSTSLGGTGQRLEAEIGLYFYNARFYDATLGRFSVVKRSTLLRAPKPIPSSPARRTPWRWIDMLM